MNPYKLFSSFIAAAVVTTAAVAQSSTASSNASLLGSRVAELGFGFVSVKGSSLDLYATGATVNIRVSTGLDIAAGVSHAWVEANSSIDTTTANLSAIAYRDFASVRGFAVASLGYAWFPGGWGDDWSWALRLGTEFDLSPRFTAIASAGYDDLFDNNSEGTFDGSLRLNYRASDRVLPYVETTLIEGGNWGAVVGLAFKF